MPWLSAKTEEKALLSTVERASLAGSGATSEHGKVSGNSAPPTTRSTLSAWELALHGHSSSTTASWNASDSCESLVSTNQDGTVTGSSSQEITGLIQHAKQMALQLESLVQQAEPLSVESMLVVEGQPPPTYQQLLHRLESVLAHQRQINQVTCRMTTTNYMVNMANFMRNKQLRALVRQGKLQLAEMRSQVAELEHQVDSLSTDVAVQEKVAERLKASLDVTRSLLDSAVTEYRKEMAKQRSMLWEQQSVLKRLMEAKFHQDLLVDAGSLLLAIWITRSALVRYPISGISTAIGWLPLHILWSRWRTSTEHAKLQASTRQRRDRTRFLHAVLQLIALLSVLQKLRKLAKEYGVHAQVGSAVGYASWTVRRLLLAMGWRTKGKEVAQDPAEPATTTLDPRSDSPTIIVKPTSVQTFVDITDLA